MKTKKQWIMVFLGMICMVWMLGMPANAKTIYDSYITTTLAQKYGSAIPTGKSTYSASRLGSWFWKTGLVSWDVVDLNGGKKELVVTYLQNRYNYGGYVRDLRLAVYGQVNGQITELCDISLRNNMDGGTKGDFSLYTVKKGKKTYLLFQGLYGIDGTGIYTYLFQLTAGNKLKAVKATVDPGYTSGGTGLYKIEITAPVDNNLQTFSYYQNGKHLYRTDDMGKATSQSKYKTYLKALQKTYGGYGISFKKWKGKYGVKTTSKCKCMMRIAATSKYNNGNYAYNIKVSR